MEGWVPRDPPRFPFNFRTTVDGNRAMMSGQGVFRRVARFRFIEELERIF